MIMENNLSTLTYDANLVVDCDEILYNISPKWCKKIYEMKDVFEPYLRIDILEKAINAGEDYENIILSRDKFYLNQWLKKENVELPEEVYNKFMDIHNAIDFYDDLRPTAMGIGISRLSYHKNIKKVCVVTRHASINSLKSKMAAIRGLFPSGKLDVRILGANQKKSDVIKDIDLTNGFIFEDEISNIKDYLENGKNVTKCNIVMPVLGYNMPDEQTIKLLDEREVCLLTY